MAVSDVSVILVWREKLKGLGEASLDAPKCKAAVWWAIGGWAWYCEVSISEKGATVKRQSGGVTDSLESAKGAAQTWLTETMAAAEKAKISGGVTRGKGR